MPEPCQLAPFLGGPPVGPSPTGGAIGVRYLVDQDFFLKMSTPNNIFVINSIFTDRQMVCENL